jgi:pyridoxal phosphate enzyme (YggS family)
VSVVVDVAGAVGEVRDRVDAAARRAGRDPAAVRVIGATKTVPVERIGDAIAAGLTDLGENRAQELLAKAPALGGDVCWHFLGQLQRNKIKALADHVTWWHSVDRPALAPALSKHAPAARVLVEVNLGDEPQKAGCAPGEAAALVDTLRGAALRVEGLMTVPPRAEDPRRCYAELRDLAEALELPHLSMGMTDDYEVAVEEGATMVRIGRALFGER